MIHNGVYSSIGNILGDQNSYMQTKVTVITITILMSFITFGMLFYAFKYGGEFSNNRKMKRIIIPSFLIYLFTFIFLTVQYTNMKNKSLITKDLLVQLHFHYLNLENEMKERVFIKGMDLDLQWHELLVKILQKYESSGSEKTIYEFIEDINFQEDWLNKDTSLSLESSQTEIIPDTIQKIYNKKETLEESGIVENNQLSSTFLSYVNEFSELIRISKSMFLSIDDLEEIITEKYDYIKTLTNNTNLENFKNLISSHNLEKILLIIQMYYHTYGSIHNIAQESAKDLIDLMKRDDLVKVYEKIDLLGNDLL